MSTPATQDTYNLYVSMSEQFNGTEHLEEVRGILYSLYYGS